MNLQERINFILSQKSHSSFVSIDMVLKNGNITLRAFQLISYDIKSETIKGLTQQEAYSYTRENRVPSYCKLKLSEIKEINFEPMIKETTVSEAK
ncbi:MAG: hypothetical protein EAZ07_03925 [Cytophagales bacterium]|nr:MAG: hypothetical protein EAZ07_03925 [Cytophagales bacterium]